MQYVGRDHLPLAGLAQVATTIVTSTVDKSKQSQCDGQNGNSDCADASNNRRGVKRTGAQLGGQPRKKRSRSSPVTVVWYRGHDLRVSDHPALSAALRRGGQVYPVFIWAPQVWSPGEASKWWLKKSLESLKQDLARLNMTLTLRVDYSTNHSGVRDFVSEVKADTIYWHRRYSSSCVVKEEALRRELIDSGIDAQSLKSELLVEPWELESKFTVLHDYMKAWMNVPPPPMPVPEPAPLSDYDRDEETPVSSMSTEQLGLTGSKERDLAMSQVWEPGSATAVSKLCQFLENSFRCFGEGRCRRDLYGTSKLSPHVQFGEVSPRQIYHSIRQKLARGDGTENTTDEGVDRLVAASRAFLKNLCLREFAHHLLYYHPNATNAPLVPEFAVFPWSQETSQLACWESARTGYPLVDAAMRELQKTGWVHNILRFLLASFLTKYILLPWQYGVTRFYNLLVDGDLTSNVVGWQWSCGCNSDSFPISSLFNPVALAKKKDPTGFYVRKWLPELVKLPDKYIHCPWRASPAVLRDAGIVLGTTYPAPIVSASFARQRARKALLFMRGVLNSHKPSRWSLVQSSEVLSTEQEDTEDQEDASDLNISALWQLCPNDRVQSEADSNCRPLFISPRAAVSVLKPADDRNELSRVTPSQSLTPSTQAPRSEQTVQQRSEAPESWSGRRSGTTIDLAERKNIVGRIAADPSHELHKFAVHINSTYELTDNTDRCTSKDYVRLCTLRDQYHRSQDPIEDSQRMTVYKVKNFFGKILKMEVTGEWDRHNHGGVRGPYVYGIRSLASSGENS
mmetsp:Transcript_10491/g.32066  ORF Transcript_10491/g.32066 Transcript_10491/m.32066 type:complete len:796 (-) Transcript_10491:71-2458(-)